VNENQPDRRLSRRRLMSATTAVAGTAVAATVLPSEPAGATPTPSGSPRRWTGKPGSSGVTLRWLGNNAWDITFGSTTILIDPWVTRFPTGTYTTGTRPDTLLVTDGPTVDRYISRANLILVCHGHFDHLADVPYVALKTGAAVLGTDSHLNMLRALDTPEAQLTFVRGGEYLQYEGFTVEVFESLHSLTGLTGPRKQVPFPGTRPLPIPEAERPRTIADLVEGGTLAYQITIAEQFRILALSTANYVERELSCLRPDLAIVAVGGGSIHDYVGRLMRALDKPTWVLPTHWDDFDLPLSAPARDFGALQPFRAAVATSSPHTTFVTLDHLEKFTP
jgi:L-ascorbate metabolism protein UlaG (beta-lactamase superfamily)